MTTATKTVRPAAPWTGTATIDFDTRLELASIAIDVSLALAGQRIDSALQHTGGDVSADAHDAVAEAAWYARMYARQVQAYEADRTTESGSSVLAAAGDVIRQLGWCQDNFYGEAGAVCALGAIRVAVGNVEHDAAQYEIYYQAAEILQRRVRAVSGHRTVHEWNDAAGRTVDEVLSLLW